MHSFISQNRSALLNSFQHSLFFWYSMTIIGYSKSLLYPAASLITNNLLSGHISFPILVVSATFKQLTEPA